MCLEIVYLVSNISHVLFKIIDETWRVIKLAMEFNISHGILDFVFYYRYLDIIDL